MSNRFKKKKPPSSFARARMAVHRFLSSFARIGSAMRRFLKKRYKWFAIAGGVLLTITLVVRDTIQEPNRELVNKIETIGRIDALHNVSLSTNAAVAELTDDIQSSGILANPPKKKDPNEQVVDDFDLANRKLSRRLGSTELGFYDILDVAKLLPDYKGSEVETFCNDTKQSIDQYKGFLDARMKYHPTDGKIIGQIPEKWMGNGIDLSE
jgi:hypothetical protein